MGLPPVRQGHSVGAPLCCCVCACFRGYCQTQDQLVRLYDPLVTTYTNDKGAKYRLRRSPDQLLDAAYEYMKAYSKVLDPERLELDIPHAEGDPLRCCSVCARTFRSRLEDGTPVPDLPVAVAADASTGCCQFAAQGTAQEGEPPSTALYLGSLAEGALDDSDTNKLQQLSKQGELQEEEEEATAEAAGQRPPVCTTNLHCSRTSAGSNAKLRLHGLVGLVCTHIIPLLGLFLPMPTYEQHYYYDVLFEDLLTDRPDVAFIYLDLACRYIKRFGSARACWKRASTRSCLCSC
ncbi:hypothetical protein ABPG75_013199 [Micractinium tetrahymenae]